MSDDSRARLRWPRAMLALLAPVLVVGCGGGTSVVNGTKTESATSSQAVSTSSTTPADTTGTATATAPHQTKPGKLEDGKYSGVTPKKQQVTFVVSHGAVAQFSAAFMRCQIQSIKVNPDGSFGGQCILPRPKQAWQVSARVVKPGVIKGKIIHIPLTGKSRHKSFAFGWIAKRAS